VAAAANGIVVYDSPDANITLVMGSVVTGSGSVNIGNGSGAATVQVAISTLEVTTRSTSNTIRW